MKRPNMNYLWIYLYRFISNILELLLKLTSFLWSAKILTAQKYTAKPRKKKKRRNNYYLLLMAYFPVFCIVQTARRYFVVLKPEQTGM